jgi:hypothetical protein
MFHPTAASQGLLVPAPVIPVPFERDAEEVAEFADLFVGARQEVALEGPEEEVLDRVFGVVRIEPRAAGEGVQGQPVGLAEFIQGRLSHREGLVADSIDQSPASGGKNAW